MSRISRIGIVHGALALFALALIGRAFQVQVMQGRAWAARAARQHFTAAELPAPRGLILDASGQVLAESRELVRLAIAPREVREPVALATALRRAGVREDWIARATDRRRIWVELPGRFPASDVASAVSIRGVRAEPVVERAFAGPPELARVIGRVRDDGHALDGIEAALDSLLRGESGREHVARGAGTHGLDSPTAPGTPARAGHTVTLTINRSLQEICERALADAVARMGASGGDIVVLDPNDGAVLALASERQDVRSTTSTALTEPYEPGSTLKPFVAAALLERGRTNPDEIISTHGGQLTLEGRTITDLHRAAQLSVADVIAWSSNVGIVELARRLSPREEYETLRDLGFGTPTGVQYPSEAAGLLREPRRWSRQSPASLAMGYEISVTPLQLATAYAAIANGGELLEPGLVREVRDAAGAVRWRRTRRVVRRVMSPEVAAKVRHMLVATVEKGTALSADLATFTMAGKSGTARRTESGHYASGKYTASFVGLFPAESPQYVVLVKLDNPDGVYFGGATAAPVSKVVIQAALAARDAALDRSALAAREHAPRTAGASGSTLHAELSANAPEVTATVAQESGTVPYVLTLDAPPAVAAVAERSRTIPAVDGLSLREQVRVLHAAGFRVQLVPGAPGTSPAQGTLAHQGDLIRLASHP